MLKLSSVGVGVAGILVAFAFMSVQSALDAWWALASIFSGGMLGLFLLGYISRKARNFDAVLGVVCGVILVCWIVISPFVHANLAIVFGTLLIFLVGFLSANLLNKRRDVYKRQILYWFVREKADDSPVSDLLPANLHLLYHL